MKKVLLIIVGLIVLLGVLGVMSSTGRQAMQDGFEAGYQEGRN